MNFGFGPGEIVALGRLAWKVYKSCKDAPESFKNVSQEALSLHALLMEVGENLSDETLSLARQARLKTIGDGCRNVLEELQSLVDKYESLGTQSKRTWDRMKWGYDDIAELRSRLSSNTLLLTAFISTTQVVVEKKLDKLLQNFQDGKYEGSVITTQTVESLSTDEKETWRMIRKELEGIGITVAAFDTNRDFIMDWFKTAVASGAFGEQTLEDTSSPQRCGEQRLEDTSSARTWEEDLGQHWPDARYPTDGRSVTELLDPLTIQNTATQNSITLRVQSAQEVTQKAISSPVFLPAGELRNTAEASRMPQKAPARGGHITRAATLIAWVLCYDKELIHAASRGQKDVVQRLLEKGANVNAKGGGLTALVWAAWKGHKAVVRLLLENGADVNGMGDGETALQWAIKHGDEAVVRLLLERGADFNVKVNGLTALVWAAWKGHEAVVRLLLDNGADVNAMGSGVTALVLAAWYGYRAVVRLLLEKGVDVNAKGKGGTALQLAAWGGHGAMVRLLLENGADVNAKGKGGTALQLAAGYGNEAVVRLLLENGADVHALEDGKTALQWAARYGDEAVVRLLLEKGADINLKGKRGTALQLAAGYGNEAVVRLLLENGADVNAQEDLKTALQWAADRGYKEVVQLLRAAALPPN